MSDKDLIEPSFPVTLSHEEQQEALEAAKSLEKLTEQGGGERSMSQRHQQQFGAHASSPNAASDGVGGSTGCTKSNDDRKALSLSMDGKKLGHAKRIGESMEEVPARKHHRTGGAETEGETNSSATTGCVAEQQHTNAAVDSSFDVLVENQDALLQFLVRTPAQDHGALRCVCKMFRNVLDSEPFRRERMLSEFAEVQAKVLTRDEQIEQVKEELKGEDFELDEDEFLEVGRIEDGYEEILRNEIRVSVDNKPAGFGRVTLVERHSNYSFHELCDIPSADLESVGCLFFDKRGRPILKSVKGAMMQEGDGGEYLAYIDKFELHKEYRQHTWVGACALQQLLLEGALQNQWSIAIYIADCVDQSVSGYDTSARHELSEIGLSRMMGHESEESNRTEKKLRKHLKGLSEMDLRQFLRAGFQQPEEAVLQSSCYHAFCVPHFLKHPMPSHQEAMAIPFIRKPPPPTEKPTGVNAELRAEAIRFSVRERELNSQLADTLFWERDHRSTVMRAVSIKFGLHEKLETLVKDTMQKIDDSCLPAISALEKQIAELPESDDALRAALEHELGSARSQMYRLRDWSASEIRGSESTILQKVMAEHPEVGEIINQLVESGVAEQTEKWTKERADMEPRFKTEVTKLLDEGATVFDSNALHACAAHLCFKFMEILLEFIPSNERRSAVNKRDPEGITPLMAAAEAHGREGWTPYIRLSADTPDIYMELRYRIMETLIGLGADKSITDIMGETALGKYRRHRQFATSVTDMTPEQQHTHERFEALLRPLGGPTAADDAVLAGESDDELSDSGWDEDEESIEEDNDGDESSVNEEDVDDGED